MATKGSSPRQGGKMFSPRRSANFFRKDVIATISVIGLALNFIGSLGPILILAKFAHYIVQHWVMLTSFIWIKIFAFLHIDIPPILGFALTMFLFHVGLIASGVKPGELLGTADSYEEAATVDRDRLFAILLYLPIMWGTLSTAFSALAAHIGQGQNSASGLLVILAFCFVIASPIVTFWLARPRMLIRRFVTVYVVVTGIIIFDSFARFLEATELNNTLSDAG